MRFFPLKRIIICLLSASALCVFIPLEAAAQNITPQEENLQETAPSDGANANDAEAGAGADSAAPAAPDIAPVPQPKYIPPQKPNPIAPSNAPASAPAAPAGDASSDNAGQAADGIVAPQNPPTPVPSPGNGGTEKIGLQDAQQRAQDLADKFSQIRTMMGDFVQFDPRGHMSVGHFYLQRPGRILFDYTNSPLRVICDGAKIAVNNQRLGSWNYYDLNKSPLNLLLADKINISNGRLLEFTQEPNAITVVLGDATGRARIKMIFDPNYNLKQWTMTDNGQDTTVQVTNTKVGVVYQPDMFNINYYRHPPKKK